MDDINQPAEAAAAESRPAESAAEPAQPADAPAENPAESAASLLDGENATPDRPAAAEPAGSLLDDSPKQAQPERTADDQPPSDEQVADFCKAIPALDLGDGVQWSDDTLKAVAPALMKMTGGDAKKAEPVVRAYADYARSVARKQQEAADAFSRGLIAEDRKRFGADLPRIVADARRGLEHVFGKKLADEMKTVPQFANNPDILERLAAVGRSVRTDTGHVTAEERGEDKANGDVLHRMYGNVKV